MREIERDYGLRMVAPSIESERKAPTKGEIEYSIRTGQASTRQQLQQLCDGAAKDCDSFSTYQERLEAAGVELVPVVQLNGAKLSGLSYRLDGVTMKGSDLGKGYSPAGLAKRGVTYEQGRDFTAVSRAIERETVRAFGDADRGIETDQDPERGGVGADRGAISAGDGRTDGRSTSEHSGFERAELRDRTETQVSDGLRDEGLRGSHERREKGSGRDEKSRGAAGVETLRADSVSRGVFGGARERILDLASTHATVDARPEGNRGVAQTGSDRSLKAVEKQIAALNVPRFEVGIREAKTGQMMNREWLRSELKDSISWLKRMNAKGNDVYIRPAGEHGLVLVDDLKTASLERMKSEGWNPAAVIETSPGNYQAWVKLSDKPLSADVRRIAAQGLAKQYGGDPNSADSRHYGRLAGFTNQKPQHARDGRQPYVLAHDCPGKAARAAPAHLERIEQHLDRAAAQQEREKRLEALETAKPGGYGSQYDPVKEYQRQAQRLMQRYGKEADFSRLDWMIATDMAKSGRFTAQDIEKGIRECSPHVESRKAGHVEDYARRTAANAWAAPEVQAHRQERERQAQRSRDRDGPGMSR